MNSWNVNKSISTLGNIGTRSCRGMNSWSGPNARSGSRRPRSDGPGPGDGLCPRPPRDPGPDGGSLAGRSPEDAARLLPTRQPNGPPRPRDAGPGSRHRGRKPIIQDRYDDERTRYTYDREYPFILTTHISKGETGYSSYSCPCGLQFADGYARACHQAEVEMGSMERGRRSK